MCVLLCVTFCRVAHCNYSKDFKIPVSWSWSCSTKLSTTSPYLSTTPFAHCTLPTRQSFAFFWHSRGLHKGCTALTSGNLLLVVTWGTVQPLDRVKCNLQSRKLFLLSQACLPFSSFLHDQKCLLCSKHWLKDITLDHRPVLEEACHSETACPETWRKYLSVCLSP